MDQQPKQLNPLFLMLALALIFALAAGVFSLHSTPAGIPYSEVLDQFRNEKVSSFTLEGSTLTLRLRGENGAEKSVTASIGDTELFHKDLDELIADQYASGVLTSYNYLPAPGTPWYREALPYVVVGVILLVVFFVLMGRANGGPSAMAQFTRANAHFGLSGKEKVTFADVAGADEEKAELQQIVDFLRNPKRFYDMGAHVPKGVLLVGPPGTGKTLLARAVAGEAGVSFLSISGSDFVELYVGVGASRVRDLFEQAKRVSPSIVFIDEIDAVGRQRGAGLGGGHDEREQTLNQLLVEMDGFGKNEGVIVMAATNRKDILDPALLRPGRFDRQIYVGTPDWRGREDILKIHAKDKPLADNVDLSAIAKATAGFTGADLENLMNESALLATERNRCAITMKDMEDAMIKVIAGPEKRSRVVPQHERKLTAYHEAGHAVTMYHLPTQDPVHQLTIIPRGTAGGMTISLPTDDTSYLSRNEMYETIVSFLGGRVAEQLKLDDISTGASNDIQRATGIARDMVSRYGMSSRLGPVSYASDDEVFIGRSYEKTKSYSERIAGDIDDEVHAILQKAYEQCAALLRAHDAELCRVADFLMAHGTMSRVQFEAAMQARPIPESPEEPSAFEFHPNEAE
ncbi:aTP-dependent zinc metalloprotease FtsH 1 [Firmicutes bacterium CAG:170]|nr:aTP-dependent zinc metalloprotease FtsH 1 [Firmicutes bacterium CAG:170]